MITGIISALIAIVVLPAAIGDGNMGTFWIFLGIIAVLLFFGLVSRADDRAYVNKLNYWSRSGKERAMMRHEWEAEAREEEERRRKNSRNTYEKIQEANGLTKVGNTWTAGKVNKQDTTYPCPTCRGVMREDHRVEYSSGAVFVTYKCEKCGKEMPVKIK